MHAESHPPVKGWAERQTELLAFCERQIFFVGGGPRSGTTWTQRLLDAHPDVSCRGEALFLQNLATPLDALFKQRIDAIAGKNERIFKQNGGYPLPDSDHADQMIATGILLALRQQCAGKPSVTAVGEKTPENVFFFPRLLRLFLHAKFIAIARDPRDVLTSTWHFFHNGPGSGEKDKIAFLRMALPSLGQGARAIQSFCATHPSISLSLTYEALVAATSDEAARAFVFLGVATDPTTVSGCVASTSFAAMTGRARGTPENGSFFRAGIVGSWRDTLDERMNEMMVQELGWMFEISGGSRERAHTAERRARRSRPGNGPGVAGDLPGARPGHFTDRRRPSRFGSAEQASLSASRGHADPIRAGRHSI